MAAENPQGLLQAFGFGRVVRVEHAARFLPTCLIAEQDQWYRCRARDLPIESLSGYWQTDGNNDLAFEAGQTEGHPVTRSVALRC